MIQKVIIETYMTPEEVTAERKQLKMTIKEYAEHCGVSIHTVKSWVNGRRHRLVQKEVLEGGDENDNPISTSD